MINIKFYVISKNKEFSFSEKEISDFNFKNEKIGINIKYIKIFNNKDSICKKNNELLLKERSEKNKNTDFIFFMHADVKFNLDNFIEKLLQFGNFYDVIGLCGCDKISYSETPFNWFCGSRKFPKHRWGYVMHSEINSEVFFNFHSPDVKHKSVSCIDGLCIIFGRTAIYSEMLFDEKFEFDFYDSDISFQTIINYKMKLGVIIEKSLIHYSIGKGILLNKFKEIENIFRKKWDPILLK